MAERKEEKSGDVPKIGERFFGAPDRRKSKPEQVTRASFSKTTTTRPGKKTANLIRNRNNYFKANLKFLTQCFANLRVSAAAQSL